VQNPFLESVQTIAELTGVARLQAQSGGDPSGCGTGTSMLFTGSALLNPPPARS
jgi:hypothetical protein